LKAKRAEVERSSELSAKQKDELLNSIDNEIKKIGPMV